MSGWNNPLPIGQSNGELYGGPWRKFSPGCSEAIAHDARTGEQPPHRTNSRGWRTSMLATTRILVSKLATTRILVSKLATARVFRYLPTTHNSLTAPSLSPRDLSVPMISSDKGSGIPHRLRQWTHRRWFLVFLFLCTHQFLIL